MARRIRPDIARTGAGNPGFDGRHEFDLAVGSVFGVRAWTVRIVTDVDRSSTRPAMRSWVWTADSFIFSLAGMRGGLMPYVNWVPGVNLATCKDLRPTDHVVPEVTCGCGFWAYWHVSECSTLYPYLPSAVDVFGVVEGFGRTLIGDRGFRSEKARIVGLNLRPSRLPHDDRDVETSTRLTVTNGLRVRYDVPVYEHLDDLIEAHPPTAEYRADGS